MKEKTMVEEFVHLHTHTHYSPLDGCATPKEYFEECAKRNYKAIAITEHGNMASVPDCYWLSRDTGIKYIPGVELYYNDGEAKRKEIVQNLTSNGKKVSDMGDDDKNRYNRHRHLTVLCKNMIGYKNLLNIRHESYLHGFYRKPRTSFDMIKRHHEGLIILSGCMNGPISFEIMEYINKQKTLGKKFCNIYLKNALKIARDFKNLMGDDYYIELQMPGVENDVELFRELLKIAKVLNIKAVLTNDAHYIDEQDYELQRIMMAIDQGTTVDSEKLFISDSKSGYLKTRQQLRETFTSSYMDDNITLDDFELMCDNTIEITNKCTKFEPDLDFKLPVIENADDKLKKLTGMQLIKMGLHKDKRYIHRLKHELDRIIEKEFSSYFLICRDIVKKSTDMGMPVGPRGSAAGSLVCYLIGIHDIDPILMNLSFERFLSSSRGGKLLEAHMDGDVYE